MKIASYYDKEPDFYRSHYIVYYLPCRMRVNGQDGNAFYTIGKGMPVLQRLAVGKGNSTSWWSVVSIFWPV